MKFAKSHIKQTIKGELLREGVMDKIKKAWHLKKLKKILPEFRNYLQRLEYPAQEQPKIPRVNTYGEVNPTGKWYREMFYWSRQTPKSLLGYPFLPREFLDKFGWSSKQSPLETMIKKDPRVLRMFANLAGRKEEPHYYYKDLAAEMLNSFAEENMEIIRLWDTTKRADRDRKEKRDIAQRQEDEIVDAKRRRKERDRSAYEREKKEKQQEWERWEREAGERRKEKEEREKPSYRSRSY